MDYKEKYEQALKIAQETYDKQPMYRDWLDKMFPELAESEDEKVRNGLVRLLKELLELGGVAEDEWDRNECEKYIAWLEKQGEQKPILDIEIPFGAKDGDVLATKAGGIFIYKELLYDKPFAYCGVDKFGVFKDCNCGNGLDWTPYLSNVTPATKEQRDLLFQKMKEAGYEWDANKKKLKEIEKPADVRTTGYWHVEDVEQKPTDEEMKRLLQTEYEKGRADAIAEMQKEWSEEDELQMQAIIDLLPGLTIRHNWLKSLKGRVQPKQEWSEEDNVKLQRIIDFLWYNRKGDTDAIYQQEQDIDWLKSLRPQNKWKPSDEQMKALNYVVNLMASSESPKENDYYYNVFKDLRKQLKKLKEGKV